MRNNFNYEFIRLNNYFETNQKSNIETRHGICRLYVKNINQRIRTSKNLYIRTIFQTLHKFLLKECYWFHLNNGSECKFIPHLGSYYLLFFLGSY